MLNRISTLFSQIGMDLRSRVMRRKFLASSGSCSFSVSATDIFLAYATRKAGKLALQFCDKVPLPKSGSIISVLSPLVEQYHLKHVPCLWMLDAKDYQLFPMEALPVDKSEFQSAIRWKMKANLSYDLQDAVLDKYFMPLQKGVNVQKMMTVVATQQNYLQYISAQIKESGLDLNVIDIPELGLRNITAFFESDEKATALIYLSQKSGQLIITRERELYLTRRIAFDVDLFKGSLVDEQKLLEKLALEVQRSFDYFHTQWRSLVPERIFLAAPEIKPLDMANALSQYLGATVTSLPINEIIENESGVPFPLNIEFLPLIGGLLREETLYATAN